MGSKAKKPAIYQRKLRLLLLYLLIALLMSIFLLSILKTVLSERKIPSRDAVYKERSYRGKIISADRFTLSDSQKSYKAVVRAESITKEKKQLFATLFSLYADKPESEILKKLEKKRGNIVLADDLDHQRAMQLKQLARKLRRYKIFHTVKNRYGVEILYGLDIIETGERRRFRAHDILEPLLGFVKKSYEKGYVRPVGMAGLERAYEKHLRSKKDGYFKGKRDVLGTVIHNKYSIDQIRVDGLDLHLNIPIALQRRIELMLDAMKSELQADEILLGIMESKTGKVLTLASSNRYDPAHIRKSDIANLYPKFSVYTYEAGSVIKPITLSLAIDKGRVTPQSYFNTYNGVLRLDKKHKITDDEPFASLSATDIIVHSSNIGISQIAWRLSGEEFRDGLLRYGFGKPSGIDLARDFPGSVRPLHELKTKLYRANSSYGYGFTVTFAQLLKAYSVFNNDGLAVTPHIVAYFEDADGKKYLPKVPAATPIVSATTARNIHDILLQVVARGTGTKAQFPGLEIGGKTGTAHIAKHGGYVREYHSSFYGFANDDKGHRYTIGVLVVRAKGYHKYFASQSAVPTFKKAVQILVDLGYLVPKVSAETKKREALYGGSQSTETATPQRHASPQNSPNNTATHKESVGELFKKTATKHKPHRTKKVRKRTSHKHQKKKRAVRHKRPSELFEDLF